MQPASTIHRVIYNYDNVKEYKVDGVEGSETYRCYADLKVNVDTAEAVYIIDDGIAIGLAGIVMLNSGGNLNGNPWGAL
ncbi:hypothetical protein ACTXQV_49945, partial [Klebsiella pneumoniae]